MKTYPVAQNKMKATPTVAATLLLMLTGCAIGPSYEQPEFTPPAAYVGAANITVETPASPAGELTPAVNWWEGFQDPILSGLVQDAIAANLSIAEAEARLGKARSLRRLSQSDFLPGLQVDAQYEESEISKIRTGGNVDDRKQKVWEAGFDSLWELDLWGRIRREVESSRATENAELANLDAVQQSVASEVARTYIELRGSQQQVAVAERNAVSQSETVRLTQSQFDAGQVTELDVARARSELALTQATIPPLRSAVEQSAFRLGVLLGREPAALLTELLQPQPIPLYRVAVGLDEPSIMLRRRPEVLRAEEELKAAVAQIGVELGEYFPKLEILGSLSIEGDSWGALRNDPTRVFSVGPRLTWRGLDGGRVSNRVAGARADADGAEARYRSAVLMALEEVEAGLSRYGSERTRVQHLKVALEQSQRSVTLAKRQYEAGAIDLLSVLDSERRMLEAEDSLARGETQAMVSLVATIKALGVPVISEDARPS